MWENLKPINLEKIETINFPDDQYFKEIFKKTIIVLHHTISGDGVNGDITTWEDDPVQVATCIIVDRAGIPWQLFSSKYWAYHLGLGGNHALDKHSIGIEIDNWGWLIPKSNGKYKTYYGNEVYVKTQYYPNGFRGYNYYEKYNDAQIRTVGELLLYWNIKYNIPLTYNEDMWKISQNALKGTPGIWTHVSYRPACDKTDAHPQPELIQMLQTLDKISI
jgi:N-acetyl-anhydromuramyl-L-alanine amidase AmpD